MPYGFKYLLVNVDGQPPNPAAVFVPPSRTGGWEEFMLGDGSRFRIVSINTEVDVDGLEELYERGINDIWTLEPAE